MAAEEENKINVLVIGSGGREHAILWSLKKSPLLSELYVLPGSDAMKDLATQIDTNINNSINVIKACKDRDIKLVVIGPEEYIINGLGDVLKEEGIYVFAPSKAAAKLESSKSFTKELCKQYGIPTAEYGYFVNINEAKQFVDKMKKPVVVKADGLTSGKGAIVCKTIEEAYAAIDLILVQKKFGIAGESIIIEEFLEGEEVSFFTFVDETNFVILGSAQDYKTVNENNEGVNTGGMGAYSPVSVVTEEVRHQIIKQVIYPTIHAMKEIGRPFTGILFAGLMITKTGPKLLEYNVRFGDPETQAILPRLESDLLEFIWLTAKGELGTEQIQFNKDATVCVVVASKGYPDEYQKNSIIRGLDKIEKLPDILVFHAGTKLDINNNWISNGGRVLNIVARGKNIEEARYKAYAALDMLDWPEGFFRYDIAKRS
ncbi:MAG: phosphoribosylamine--glycine ligase [Candidatus Mesenet longicola]|uniref:Phosphoribosylamine--glycine ligase n=1 Tax=Candidatus Mesenet longicola TaxID=1892558 RepID=A0A8J3HQ90_9RICK|nr:MAG: phosphoribosylamine--glycine ligase [Candidatus Mesenet longicola]GHM60084.1 MAG: phosphoribosylamine--glycine ligase [Candidatus Mesenet longicola]